MIRPALLLAVALAGGSAHATGMAVSVMTAKRSCFTDAVDAYGVILPRNEVSVRSDRPGLRVDDILVEPGERVTQGQTLARLSPVEGPTVALTAPSAGLVSASTAVIGATASGRGEAVFTIIARNEFDMIAMVPARELAKIKVEQRAAIKLSGAGDLGARVKQIAPTVEPVTQQVPVTLAIDGSPRLLLNASARAIIQAGESCNIAVPLSALLAGPQGTLVQIVRRDAIETRRVTTGLMSEGRVEIVTGLSEGDVVVQRAGALLREGDAVRPVTVEGK